MGSDNSTESTLRELLEEAFKTYQDQTGRKIQNDTSLLRKVRTTKDLLDEVELRNKNFEKFREHHDALWGKLKTCLKPLDTIGHTLQNAVTSTPIAPAVFASVLHLVNVRARVIIQTRSIIPFMCRLATM